MRAGRRSHLAMRSALGAWLAIATLAAAAAPPKPATEREAAALLARFKELTGGAGWDRIRALHTSGTVETGGLRGTFDTWEELGTGRGTSRYHLGPMSGAEGFDGEAPWSQDAAGEVTIQRGEEALEAARNEAYRTTLAWWYPERWPAALRAQPDQSEGERTFAVVEITPKGGRPFELWIDEATGLPDRAVERGGLETITTTLGDWRTVETAPPGSPGPAPVRLPFSARTGTGDPKFDVVVQATAVEVDPPLEADAFAPPRRRADDFALAGGASSIVVPFELRNNHVYVQVALDGHRALPMLFDSGGFNLVTPKTAKLLGLKTEGSLPARGVGEGVEELAITRVGEVRLGGATLRDQVFYELPLAGMAEVERIDVAGVLGFEVLQRFVVEIDYVRRRLTLRLPERFDASRAGTAVPFVFAGHMPAAEGTIDGLAGRFTIDTGSRGAVALHRPFVERHALVDRYKPEIDAVTGWGVGGGVRAKITRAGVLTLGAVEVPLPIAELVTSEKGAFTDRYLAGNVGGGVLRRFRVTFDYRRETLYLAPGGDATADDYDRTGMWLVDRGRELYVEDLIPGAPAAAAGIMPGDRLLALDGVGVKKLGAAAVRARLHHDPPGTRVRLRVRSGGLGSGGSREVEAVLRDLPPPPVPALAGAGVDATPQRRR